MIRQFNLTHRWYLKNYYHAGSELGEMARRSFYIPLSFRIGTSQSDAIYFYIWDIRKRERERERERELNPICRDAVGAFYSFRRTGEIVILK